MNRSRSAWLAVVRDAPWLTAPRARLGALMLAAVTIAWLAAWLALSKEGLDSDGRPLGTDFLSFWAASKLALAGQPAAVYDIARHAAIEAAAFGGHYGGYFAFFYPPVYLLICLPLALLPYTASFVAWMGATGYAYGRTVRGFLGPGLRWCIAAFAFPAVFCTIGHGQNAFLTAALMGGGILALDRGRPVAAGLLFGSLVFKPHLGVLIPVLLVARGEGRAVTAAVVSALAWAAASAAVFGPDTWRAFLAIAPVARTAMEQDMIGPEKMQSAFAVIRLWHGGTPLAYAVQAVVALAACGLLVHLVRTRPGTEAGGPAFAAATLLASPFLLDYDLTLLAIPLAWTFAQARRTGFLPWEKSVLLAAYLLPLFARTVAGDFGVPLGPPVVAALFAVVIRRGLASAPAHAGIPALYPVAVAPH